MRLIKVILLVALILFFSLFVTQNYSMISLQLLSFTFTLPAFLLVLISLFIGFIIPSFYFSVKLISKTKKLNQISKALRYFYKGYPSVALHVSEQLAKIWEPAGVIYIESNFATKNYSTSLNKLERSEGLVEGYLGSQLLKIGHIQLAKEYLISAINKDENNLTALKAYRDLCYIESNMDECIKYQEKILNKCERWEKEEQKSILAELLCIYAESMSDLNEKEQLLEKAYDTYKTPFTYYHYLAYLLEIDNLKNARKVIDKVFKEGIQDEVLLMASNKEILLTKLLDTIEQYRDVINLEVLARIYIKLNMISKLQQIESNLKEPLQTIVKMHINHSKEAKTCKDTLLELYKPWECVCGINYNLYMPLCKNCYRWREIKLRRS